MIGCDRDSVDDACVADCEKAATITDLTGDTLYINKTRGTYCSLYYRFHFLNTDVVAGIPSLFSGFSIDLREIETETRTSWTKLELMRRFRQLLQGQAAAGEALQRGIRHTTDSQYRKGI